MNTEKLIDSFEFIDESMLRAVDKLRQKPKRTWQIPASVAACVLVMSVGVFAFLNFSGVFDAPDNSVSPEKMRDTETQESFDVSLNSPYDNTLNGNDGTAEGIDTSFETAETSDPTEVPSVVLKITEWNSDGFRAYVYQTVDTDVIPIDSDVTVRFSNNICVGIPIDESTARHETREPTQDDFAVGETVMVQFNDMKTENNMIYLTISHIISFD